MSEQQPWKDIAWLWRWAKASTLCTGLQESFGDSKRTSYAFEQSESTDSHVGTALALGDWRIEAGRWRWSRETMTPVPISVPFVFSVYRPSLPPIDIPIALPIIWTIIPPTHISTIPAKHQPSIKAY